MLLSAQKQDALIQTKIILPIKGEKQKTKNNISINTINIYKIIAVSEAEIPTEKN